MPIPWLPQPSQLEDHHLPNPSFAPKAKAESPQAAWKIPSQLQQGPIGAISSRMIKGPAERLKLRRYLSLGLVSLSSSGDFSLTSSPGTVQKPQE